MREKNPASLEQGLFTAGLVLIALGLTALCVFRAFPELWEKLTHANICWIRKYAGFYCPGCGGTRSIVELLHGHVLKALYYHPAAIYTVLLFAVFMISHGLQRISRGRIRGVEYSYIQLYILIGLIMANFVIKNVLLAVGHPMV